MPTRAELLATGRDDGQIAAEIGADAVIYQELDALKQAVRDASGKDSIVLDQFETSCFDGQYITGDIGEAFLAVIESRRQESLASREESQGMLDLNLNVAEQNLVQ